PHQRKCRLDGLPMMGSSLVFDPVTQEDISAPIHFSKGEVVHATLGPMDVSGFAWLWGLDFGIGHPFAAALIGHDRDADCIYVLATVRLAGSVPAIHASLMRQI